MTATAAATLPRLTARGLDIDTSPDAFGFLRETAPDEARDADLLRARLAEDGYLFLRGLLGRGPVEAARALVLERAAAEGILDPDHPTAAGILKQNVNPYFRPEYTRDNPAVRDMLYAPDGPLMAAFGRVFGGPVRHFDYTWLRAVGPGKGTAPHCDVVYMGRGTHDLLTAWTPLGDIPLSVGGLIVLENSHRSTPVALSDYLRADVDSYCETEANARKRSEGKLGWEHWETRGEWDGSITHDPVELRARLGGRWLTAPEYRMGDVLIFTMRTIHASIDNQTRALRLSTDSRYQPADAPADERWVAGPNGEAPPAHGQAVKKGKIC